jgi:hypothetical protein
LAGEAKRSMSPISEATVNALIQPNPGHGDQQRDVAVVGAQALELDRQPGDLQLEVVDHQKPTTANRHGAQDRRRRSCPRRGLSSALGLVGGRGDVVCQVDAAVAAVTSLALAFAWDERPSRPMRAAPSA